MIHLKRCAWATAAAVAVAGGATAQTTTTTTTTTPQQGGPTATLSGQQTSPIEIQEIQPPTITSTSSGAVQQSNVVATSNAFARNYANPLWQGRAGVQGTSLTTVVQPGGFGQAVYGTNAGASGNAGTTGRTTGRTGTTGAQGTTQGGATTAGRTTGAQGTALGATNRAGTTGFNTTGRGGTNQSQTAQQLSTGRQIAYTQTLRLPPIAPVAPAQIQAEVQTMLTTSFNGGGVQATIGDSGVVVLRGQVADDDEARSVAGMVLLTPGVKEVKNELTIK